jgi:hypothetical protein
MKKFLIIPLMFLYLLALTGIMVQAHYCGKQLVSWNFYLKANDCGGCSDDMGKPNVKKCCKDKVFAAKVSHEQNHVTFKLQLSAGVYIPATIPVIHHSYRDDTYVNAERPAYSAHAPPGRWQNIPLYKLHARFTYYG